MKKLTRIGRHCARHVLCDEAHLALLLELKDRVLARRYDESVRQFYQPRLRSAFKRVITTVPPHQIDAQNPFGLEAWPVNVLKVALGGLAEHHLEWLGEPCFRMAHLLHFQDLSKYLLVDQLWAALMTQELLSGRIPIWDLDGWCGRAVMPKIPSPALEALYKRGLVELHQHYNASSLPTHIWQKALAKPRALLHTAYGFKDDHMPLPRGWDRFDLYAHLCHAAWCRRLLVYMLQTRARTATGTGNCFSLPVERLHDLFTHVARIAFHYRGKRLLERPTVTFPKTGSRSFDNERFFLARAMVILGGFSGQRSLGKKDFLFYFCLHYYLLVQNIFLQSYVQQDQHFGFEEFSRFERSLGLQAYKERSFAEARRSYVRDHRLAAIEMRVVPKQRAGDYRKLEEQFQDDRQNRAKKCTGDNGKLEEKCRDNGPSRAKKLKDWGLVFHVIKEPDRQKRLVGPILVARHHLLRRKVYFSLRALCESRKRQPGFSRRYLALDAANDERFAGPEVFAPAFRLFRDRFAEPDSRHPELIRPPLAITFHAGESFEHPLSGIRYVDEALELLEMRPGDRIGHALALGIDIPAWHEVMEDEVMIASKGQWFGQPALDASGNGE